MERTIWELSLHIDSRTFLSLKIGIVESSHFTEDRGLHQEATGIVCHVLPESHTLVRERDNHSLSLDALQRSSLTSVRRLGKDMVEP